MEHAVDTDAAGSSRDCVRAGAAPSGLRGIVTGPDGALLEHVLIEIRHDGSGRCSSVSTDRAGRHATTNLLFGASADGAPGGCADLEPTMQNGSAPHGLGRR